MPDTNSAKNIYNYTFQNKAEDGISLVSWCICRLHHVCFSIKGIFHHRTGHEGPEWEQSYISTLSLTLALDGGLGGQRHAPAALPPGNTRYPLYRRLGGLQSRSGRVRKISLPLVFDFWTVQPIASCYTDWATRPNFYSSTFAQYRLMILTNVYCCCEKPLKCWLLLGNGCMFHLPIFLVIFRRSIAIFIRYEY
jgi:hypothetical protein